MARCEVAATSTTRRSTIAAGERHTIDSSECAILKVAPIREHCDCKEIGHGVDVESRFYCCAHCANEGSGTSEARDRIGQA